MVGLKEPRGRWMGCVCHPVYALQCQKSCAVNGQYSEEFGVGVGVHKGSVLSPLLFNLVLEALSLEFGTGVPWELVSADEEKCI